MKNQFVRLHQLRHNTKAIPILSFPSISLLDISVNELIMDSELQARGMKAIADRCDTLAAVSMMDLSVEAQAFGAQIMVDDHEVPTVVGRVVSTASDVENLKVPAVGAGRTGIYVEAIKKAVDLISDRPVLAGIIGPFSLSGRLMDMTEIMVNCYTEPEMVEQCVSKATEFLIDYANAYKAVGAAGVVIAEPAAGLLSPQLNEQFSIPFIKKIVQQLQSDDFAVIYHNCGNTIPLLSSIKEIGAVGYHFGNAIDIAEMLALAPSDIIIMGNIDPSSQFRNGTPQSVYQETRKVLDKCKQYPNFIISSGCDIPPLTPWENIDAFFKAVADHHAS